MVITKPTLGSLIAASARRRQEEELTLKRAAALNLPYVYLYQSSPEPRAVAMIPKEMAREARLFAFKREGNSLSIATDSPKSPATQAALKKLSKILPLQPTLYLVSTTSLNYLLHSYDLFAPVRKEAAELHVKPIKSISLDTAKVSQSLKALSTSQLLDYLLGLALGSKASDLHLEPGEKKNRVRLRLDGILYEIANLDNAALLALTNRIKLLADLRLNIRASAQDGRFGFQTTDKQKINVRVSTLPTPWGESVALRLLPEEGLVVRFEELGLSSRNLALVKAAMVKPNGLILNTGPTGSGKTTTLYAILSQLIQPGVKIVTIEDPIEYNLPGLTQTQVNPKENYTFASGLHSIVRQDPDVILVGEVRDKETAEIALQASLTGHLVLSTLHTNDAAGALPRLVELGVNANLFAEAVELIIAQRLLRRLCLVCRKEKHWEELILTPEQKARVEKSYRNLPPEIQKEYPLPERFIRPLGCAACNGLGYRGRIGIFETLKATPAITRLVADKRSIDEIRLQAEKEGMLTMEEDGLMKVLQGITTLEELFRVTKESQ